MPIVETELKQGKADDRKTVEDFLTRPRHINPLDLTEEEQNVIVEEIIDELKVIEDERSEENWESKCDAYDNQYNGEMQKLPDQMFNLDKPTTKTKIREFVRKAKKAFFKPDPAFAVSPRPEFQKAENDRGIETCEKQQDFLDHKLDDVIPLELTAAQVFHQGGLKGVGILKLFPESQFDRKSRDEVYKGENVLVVGQDGQPVADPQSGRPMSRNPGLDEFMNLYGEDVKKGKYEGYVKKLIDGKKVTVVVNYLDVTYNDVMPSSIDPKRFWVRKGTEGYQGLVKQRLKAEERDFTWWDLKDLEERYNFYNIDKLIHDKNEDGSFKTETRSKYKQETYSLFEVEYTTDLPGREDGGAKEERKGIFWVDREKKVIVGSIEYPFYSVPCYWFPYNVKTDRPGWYKNGIAGDLTDSHIAQNAMLNFTLQAAWQANTITPVTKNPEIIAQFLNKEFEHGLPLDAGPEEIRFLNEKMKYFDPDVFLKLLNYMTRSDEDVSGISSTVLSGRENPMDPNAPAAKHMMQLESTNENITDYLEVMAVTHNEVGRAILQFCYQLADEEGIKYPSKRPGKPFQTISRGEMIAKTLIQTQAMSFAFQKHNEKREDLSIFQLARQDMMIARNPDAIYALWKNLLRAWSPKMKNMVEKLLPDPSQFKQEQLKLAVQAVQVFVQQVLKQSEMTGQEPQFDPQQLLMVMQKALTEAFTNIPQTGKGEPNVTAQGIIQK